MLETVHTDQIKSFYNNKNKSKQHTCYNYYDKETFEQEINEFMPYSEVKFELKQYQQEYDENHSPWLEYSEKEQREIIQNWQDHLDFLQDEKRLSIAKRILYVSLGNYGEFMGQDNQHQHIHSIERNSQLLFKMGVLPLIKQCLNHSCQQLETPSISSQPNLVVMHCKEIDIHLTIFFLIVSFNQEKIKDDDLPEFLFDLVVRLKEHFTKTFPLKKLMLTLHKVLLISLGHLDENYDTMKESIRAACKLPPMGDKSTTIKCTPEELFQFYHQASERYPTFTPAKLPEKCTDPLTVTASTRLSKAMGLYKVSKNIDLPYQTLFPSKSQQPAPFANNTTKSAKLSMEANVLPFTEKSEIIPFSLSEADTVWSKHLYISVANFQIIHEREKAIHRWQRWKDQQQQQQQQQDEGDEEWNHIIYDHLAQEEQAKIRRINKLYKCIVPNFQSIVVVVLKLLLSTVSVGKDKEAEIVEDINITRNRETVSKAVSGILLLLLKWFKTSHVLKFEYLSQVLIDSGCMLLILKLLGLQEIALLASKKTDDDSQSFLGFIHQPNEKQEEDENENEYIDDYDSDADEDENYTNKRNLCWSINLVRILQMLTKRKTHRILLLVQYKSSAILKRLLKVGHETMHLYVLKNLRNQVPFMGRKWRSANMKTISAIYSHCLTSLNDDWLSSSEGSGDTEESAMKEINIRMLTRLYNGQRYLPSILPGMDEVSGSENTLFYNGNALPNNGKRLPEYTLNEPILVDDVELDMDFKRDYREWLEKDVYSTDGEDEEDDDDEEEEAETEENDFYVGTPIPDIVPTPLSPEELANEINKLYLEELRREFEEKERKRQEQELAEKQKEQDGWDAPTSSDNSWGTSKVNTLDDEEADEVETDFNPLQNINWEEISEEELKKRLTIVEEKTAQRWLNVEMDDERYLKVLNTFEGEIVEDDEGWPIY